ncbi:MAG: DUF4339 domain-containing protein, partial [Bryobacterales bacterium]|nr:DUF4339 domain-containing protein [Bryobacterales bacterium]
MLYFVQRSGRDFGPYTAADLKRYLERGELSPSDLFRQEHQTGYQYLRDFAFPTEPSSVFRGPLPGVPVRPQMANGAPLPPNLHWGVVLLLSLVTCGFFAMVWMLMQAWWLKQLRDGNRAIWMLAGSFGTSYAGSIFTGVAVPLMQPPFSAAEPGLDQVLVLSMVSIVVALIGTGLFIAAEIEMRRGMLDYFNSVENIG